MLDGLPGFLVRKTHSRKAGGSCFCCCRSSLGPLLREPVAAYSGVHEIHKGSGADGSQKLTARSSYWALWSDLHNRPEAPSKSNGSHLCPTHRNYAKRQLYVPNRTTAELARLLILCSRYSLSRRGCCCSVRSDVAVRAVASCPGHQHRCLQLKCQTPQNIQMTQFSYGSQRRLGQRAKAVLNR